MSAADGVFADHLGLDAIVAYVDGELGLTAFQRAAAHLVHCPPCAAEVAEQTAIQQCLRAASHTPRMPGSLFNSLTSIPLAVSGPGPLPGLTMDASGRAVRMADLPRPDQGMGRRFRLGAGALVAGLAVGAVVAAATGEHARTVRPPRPPSAEVTGVPGPTGDSFPVGRNVRASIVSTR